MNTYKIIFPYESEKVHLGSNEFDAFDKCYEEIQESGRRPKIFVVLNLDTNTPYYLQTKLESKDPDPNPLEEYVINKDVRDGVSDVLSIVSDHPIAPFSGSNVDTNVDANGNTASMKNTETFNNPMRNPLQQTDPRSNNTDNFQIPSSGQIEYLQRRLELTEGKLNALEVKQNILEEELIRTKMKVDYVGQLHTGRTNMNNLVSRTAPQNNPEQKDEGCIIM